MKKFNNVRFVVCDIDGTMVNEARVLTERTKKAIQALKEKGILFGIASGRPTDEVQNAARRWEMGIDLDCIIAMNGAELYDLITDQTFDYFKLEREWIKEIIEVMAPFSHKPYIYLNEDILCVEEDDMVIGSAKHAQKEVVIAKDVSELYAQTNGKVMFRIDAEKMPEVEAYFEAFDSPHFKAFKTQPTLIEFAHRDISKAYALRAFCEHHQISMDDVISFGDTSNDNDMLAASGIGVCLLNGTDDTKAVADYITEYTNEEDGLARFIEDYIL